MAYTVLTPLANQSKKASQPLIEANFSDIDTALSVNHVGFNVANVGKHKFITFPEQAAAPATLANEVAIYSQESALTTVTELAWRRESSGDEIEFTSSTQAADGWTRLPSGILLKWGTSTANAQATTTFPVAATVPAFTAIYTVLLTVIDAGATDVDEAIRLVSATTTTFDAYGSQRTAVADKAVGFQYLAIGI